MSPYLYQMNRLEFCNVWKSIKKIGDKEIEVPMSKSTFDRRKVWAQENYPDWRKVFLAGGRVDLKEYQKFETFRSERYYEDHESPYVKALRGDQMAYLSWCVLAIMACFLIGTIVNVIEGEKLNVLKEKYRKKHQEVMILSTKKLNKFVDLSKKLVNFKDYSIEEQEEFVSNAIAIYRNNNLGSSAITTQVARFFLFLVDPRMEVTA